MSTLGHSKKPTTVKPVLVTGATGYVAGRLIPLLLASGYRVRTMGRYRHADRIGAKNMAQAAAAKNADHIIYLGGLGDITHKNISRHLCLPIC
jgi:uncharacterized protein YbjT (DUF2867 family)